MGSARLQVMSVRDLVRELRMGRMVVSALGAPWDEPAIALFFDSLRQGYPIGLVVLWQTAEGRTVVQGKQRLLTLARVLGALPSPEGDAARWRLVYDLKERRFVHLGHDQAAPASSHLPLSETGDAMRYIPWVQGLPRDEEGRRLLREADQVATAIWDYEVPVSVVYGDVERVRDIGRRLRAAPGRREK